MTMLILNSWTVFKLNFCYFYHKFLFSKSKKIYHRCQHNYLLHGQGVRVVNDYADALISRYLSDICFSLFVWGPSRIFWPKKGNKSCDTLSLNNIASLFCIRCCSTFLVYRTSAKSSNQISLFNTYCLKQYTYLYRCPPLPVGHMDKTIL